MKWINRYWFGVVFALVGFAANAASADILRCNEAWLGKAEWSTVFTECKPAAEHGYSVAQWRIGALYNDGVGVVQNYAEAARWYKLAASQGNVYAQINLGVLYHNGNGVLQNYVLAHMWYNIASSKGFSLAIEKRDRISKQMTDQQIAEAQARAQLCQNSNYSECW